MKVSLFDFQEDALEELQKKLKAARLLASIDSPQAVSFSAPTGSGKTIVMSALFENIFFGTPDLEAQPDAVILWISDMPELNEQTRLKIEGKSDRIKVRQLVKIESTFDTKRLKGGHIYFINTQKLGTDKLLTQKEGDKRQYSIWETFTNTANAMPDKFYVVIDEAHRGMRGGSAAEKARTILQKFLLGSKDDGLCRIPIVTGISATPKRFEDLLSGTTHSLHKVYVPSEEVRKSGLIKDRILIHVPESGAVAEMTLLAEAAKRWQEIGSHWATYCESEQETIVLPILVVQVEDGTDKLATKSDLDAILSAIESVFGRSLVDKEIVHTFNGFPEIEVGSHKIRYIEASRIQDDLDVKVVLFKMSLSTGWDCPRAEAMMSFRHATDHTYIAQLLGRMVRAPLARRVEKDAALNDVHLFLPHYDQAAVELVIEDLKNVEDVPPSEAGSSRELVTLRRRVGTEEIFEAIQKIGLITYKVGAFRRQSHLRRLMGLGRALTQDRIDENAQNQVKDSIVNQMQAEIQGLHKSGEFNELAKQITGIDIKRIAVQHGTANLKINGEYIIEAVSEDIDRYFQRAGVRLGNGLQIEYWKNHGDRESIAVKVEAIVFANNSDSMQRLEGFAEKEFDKLYDRHKNDVGKLKEQRRFHYKKLRLATNIPQNIPWEIPETIPFKRSKKAIVLDRHLYVEDDGFFRADLLAWELGVIEEELHSKEVVGWLRNEVRKPWSIEIPYKEGSVFRPMFPDLVIVRKCSGRFLFDILEPHDPSRGDNYLKAVGMAEFAEKHEHLFDRIQLIRKKKTPAGEERYYRLDFRDQGIRKRVMKINNNPLLDEIFEEYAIL
jgi:type III restriction enzyme